MKRTALPRKTPLRRTALQLASPRHTRTAVPKRRTGSIVPPKVRAALKQRSGGVCEIQTPGCGGLATDDSHRLKVGMGGRRGAAAARHHVLSQLLHSCRSCHRGLHEAPAAAYWQGRMLREGEDPREVPVLYRQHWVLLDDLGGVTPTNKTTAEEATRCP
ncbi:hypothetical protein AB0F72_09385 [Actinoplanes sp. NPDC023936]|uniref:hypothetical protein n=1 Tax=Actinoplanes sp. NPDC023936 TaxID=3154910 RepID=UPI0034099D27